MTKLRALLPSFFLFTALASAAPPDTGFNIDLAEPDRKWEYSTYAGNSPAINVYLLTNSIAYTGLSGYNAELNYGKADDATALKTITGTISGNTATFQATTNSFPAHGEYFAEVFAYSGATKITVGQGKLTVLRSPSSGSYANLDLSPRINWDLVVNVGTVPWSDFATNSLQSQITSNLVNQAATNTRFEVRIISNEAFRAAQVTTNANIAARIALNDTFRTTTQPATNAGLQAEITTNAVKQTATNSAFEVRIAAEETKSTAQANTNAGLQAQITTNLVKQAATNAAFELRIAAVETAEENSVITRYSVRTNDNEEIHVVATSTNVTVARSGTVITFTIPVGTVLMSVNGRWPGNTLGSTFSLKFGTNDMPNASLATRWSGGYAFRREDTGDGISGAKMRLNISEHDRLEAQGLPTDTISTWWTGF